MDSKFIVKRTFYEGATETAEQILERLILDAARRETSQDNPVDGRKNSANITQQSNL